MSSPPQSAPRSTPSTSHNIKTLCDGADVRQIRFHDLRHTCATLLIETGVPLITVKELLGHANIAVTANIYTHTRLPPQADALKQTRHPTRRTRAEAPATSGR